MANCGWEILPSVSLIACNYSNKEVDKNQKKKIPSQGFEPRSCRQFFSWIRQMLPLHQDREDIVKLNFDIDFKFFTHHVELPFRIYRGHESPSSVGGRRLKNGVVVFRWNTR